jgi:antitoxin Phd
MPLALRLREGLGSAAPHDGKLVSVLVIERCPMQTWPIQDAKARFSEFLETCLAEGPQMVTKRGSEAAVLVPVDEWRRLQAAARPSLKQLLLSDLGRGELVLHVRGQVRRRVPAAAR